MSEQSAADRASHEPTPEGYDEVRTPGGRAVVLDVASSWARQVLASHSTLYHWAAAEPAGEVFAGRGRVHSVAAPMAGPDGRDRWAVRHYRRGGAFASLLEDRYFRLGRPRAIRELTVSVTARARGVPTPAVVAAAVYRAGLFDRYDLVTEVVPSVRPLAAWLEGSTPLAGWERSIVGAARLVRHLSDAGIVHVDLNAHNVLLSPEEPESGWVVDLDRASVTAGPSRKVARRMSARLLRSVQKIAEATGTRIDADSVGRTLHAAADPGVVRE